MAKLYNHLQRIVVFCSKTTGTPYTAEPDKETESKIYANSYFYNYTEDARPSALIGIFFAFTFDNSAGAVPD